MSSKLYSIYCEIETLHNCTLEHFENILNQESCRFIRAGKCLWYAEIEKRKFRSCLSIAEDVFFDNLEQFTNENSILILSPVSENAYGVIPRATQDFLDEQTYD